MPSSIEAAIKSSVHGLTYISESDAPIEYFSLKHHPATSAGILQSGGHALDAPIQQLSLNDFFISQDQSDAGLRHLRETLERSLTDVKVFRVGDVEVTYYVVGTAGNQSLGIKTTAVETG